MRLLVDIRGRPLWQRDGISSQWLLHVQLGPWSVGWLRAGRTSVCLRVPFSHLRARNKQKVHDQMTNGTVLGNKTISRVRCWWHISPEKEESLPSHQIRSQAMTLCVKELKPSSHPRLQQCSTITWPSIFFLLDNDTVAPFCNVWSVEAHTRTTYFVALISPTLKLTFNRRQPLHLLVHTRLSLENLD